MRESILADLIGRPVMARCNFAGVHYGTLAKCQDEDTTYAVKLVNATRVYRWTGACSLSQLALEGSTEQLSKLSVKVPSIYLKAIEVIEMTDEAVDNLNAIPVWKSIKE